MLDNRRGHISSERLTDGRDARLSHSLSGTNLERAGDYNIRAVLQIIRLQQETTRKEIVRQTGLSPPTIANITTRLIEIGLVSRVSCQTGGRGKPPVRLQINPDGAVGIGLNIDRDHMTLVVLDLAGRVRSRTTNNFAFVTPTDVRSFLNKELDVLFAKGEIDPGRILGLGVAASQDLGGAALPALPVNHNVRTGLDLANLLGELPWPVHLDDDAAAAARGEAEFGIAFDNPCFFYILISTGLRGGPVIDRSYYRGADGRSGEIGLMPDATACHAGTTVQDTVSLSALFIRLKSAGIPKPDISDLESDDPVVAKVITNWLADAVRSLTAPVVAINCLFNPGAILIGGRLPDNLNRRLATDLEKASSDLLLPARARIMPAMMAQDAPAIGAAILPFLAQILPSDSILMKSRQN